MGDAASDRLRRARTAKGYDSATAAAEAFGWNKHTYVSNENGNASFSYKKAKAYAEAFGVAPDWLYDAKASPSPAATPVAAPEPGAPVDLMQLRAFIAHIEARKPPGKGKIIDRRIPVVGIVEAGLWREAPVRELHDIEEWLSIDVQGYERAQLRAWKLSGPSMNLIYPPGRFVVTAHPAEAGLRVGDYVIVERRKADLVEVTLKEFVVDDEGRVALWPRSSDPEFQTPIYLKGGDNQDQTGPVIVGVVVADYSRRNRPPANFGRALSWAE